MPGSIYGSAEKMTFQAKLPMSADATNPRSWRKAVKTTRKQLEIDGQCVLSPHFSNCERTSGMHVQNQPSRQHQIGHCEQRVQLRGVLRHAAVAGLAVPKQVLQDVERMLDLGTDAGLDLLDP